MRQEHVFFHDNSVYISDTRIVVQGSTAYMVSGLTSVTQGRLPANRVWAILVAVGALVIIIGAIYGQFIIMSGGLGLIVAGIAFQVFQLNNPIHAVVLESASGRIYPPIKRRDGAYITQVVNAIGHAINAARQLSIQNTHYTQNISGPAYGPVMGANAQVHQNFVPPGQMPNPPGPNGPRIQ